MVPMTCRVYASLTSIERRARFERLPHCDPSTLVILRTTRFGEATCFLRSREVVRNSRSVAWLCMTPRCQRSVRILLRACEWHRDSRQDSSHTFMPQCTHTV